MRMCTISLVAQENRLLSSPQEFSSRLACWPPALLGTGGASRQELSGVSRLGVSDLTLLVVSVNVVSVDLGVCECRVHCMYFAFHIVFVFEAVQVCCQMGCAQCHRNHGQRL